MLLEQGQQSVVAGGPMELPVREPPCANILPSDVVLVRRAWAILKRTNEDTAQAARTVVRTKNFIEPWVMKEAAKVC